MIYSRADWGSKYPRGGNVINGPLAEVYVHHYNSGIAPPQTVADSMARVLGGQRYHAATQGWGDIGYSWLVDDLGNIFEGRGWWRTGAHTYGFNSKGYGICWLGDSNVSRPTHAALGAIAETVRMGVSAGALYARPTIVAHRDRVPDTSCCGDVMYAQLDEIRGLVTGRSSSSSPSPSSTEGDDDDVITLVESDNGTIYVLGGGVKRPLVPAATWGDTEWGLKQLTDGGLARWANPRKQTQGALDLIPTGA